MRRDRLLRLINALAGRSTFAFCGLLLFALTMADKGIVKPASVCAAPQAAHLRACTEVPPSSYDAAGRPNLFWKEGSVLRVRFLGGSSYVRAQVQKYAAVWSRYANITFEFVERGRSDIRVSFTQDGSSWSFIGADAADVPQNEPTMNFGWFDEDTTEEEFRRTILHEFGHALGLIHEHQSPAATIQWNEDRVIRFYREKFNWSEKKVRENIFNKESAAQTQYTAYDPDSIMHYPIPAEFITGGTPVGWNKNLSRTDIAFIQKVYPPLGR